MARLGKHTSGVACIYVNKLKDIDPDILRIVREVLGTIQALHPEEK